MECGKYRGVRLLEHRMKVYEYVLENRLRHTVSLEDGHKVAVEKE